MPFNPGHERKWRLARAWSNDALRQIAPLLGGDVANVSAWKDGDKEGGRYRDYFSAAKSYTLTNWHGERGAQPGEQPGGPGELLIDLEAPLDPAHAGRFDVVFNHTTLEHVFEVFQAFGNLARMSRDLVVVVVPCVQELHYTQDFGDFWRFSHLTLRRLCARHGLVPLWEGASPDPGNAWIYVMVVASKHPEKWRGKIPEQVLPVSFLGEHIVRNDPWTLFAEWMHGKLSRLGWYKRWSRRFIKRHFRDEGEK